MSAFKLTNDQRKFFGLDPLDPSWERVMLPRDTYRQESMLYFDQDVIKRHIFSAPGMYSEKQYDEQTKDRQTLLPKTARGKEKKLTVSVLEQRQPYGVYLDISVGHLLIGNYNSQTTFYSSRWHRDGQAEKSVEEIVESFIAESPSDHFERIGEYKKAKRKNVRFTSGDYFCFKMDRENYGFGRVLLDVNKIRKKKLIGETHGLQLLMGHRSLLSCLCINPNRNLWISIRSTRCPNCLPTS